MATPRKRKRLADLEQWEWEKAKDECGCKSLGEFCKVKDLTDPKKFVPCITLKNNYRAVICSKCIFIEHVDCMKGGWTEGTCLDFETLNDLAKLLAKATVIGQNDKGKRTKGKRSDSAVKAKIGLEDFKAAARKCGCEALGKIGEIHDSWHGDVPCITIDGDHRAEILDTSVRFERANLTQYCWDGCLNLEFDTLRDLAKLLDEVGLLGTDDDKEGKE